MKLNLTRWQQNVLLASFAWALAITVYMRYQELPKAQDYAMREYFVCAERQAAAGIKTDKCLDKIDDDWDHWMNRKWGKIAIVALTPIGACWLGIFGGLHVYRRVKGKRDDLDAQKPH